jgi:hypothetical protein
MRLPTQAAPVIRGTRDAAMPPRAVAAFSLGGVHPADGNCVVGTECICGPGKNVCCAQNNGCHMSGTSCVCN